MTNIFVFVLFAQKTRSNKSQCASDKLSDFPTPFTSRSQMCCWHLETHSPRWCSFSYREECQDTVPFWSAFLVHPLTILPCFINAQVCQSLSDYSHVLVMVACEAPVLSLQIGLTLTPKLFVVCLSTELFGWFQFPRNANIQFGVLCGWSRFVKDVWSLSGGSTMSAALHEPLGNCLDCSKALVIDLTCRVHANAEM